MSLCQNGTKSVIPRSNWFPIDSFVKILASQTMTQNNGYHTVVVRYGKTGSNIPNYLILKK